MSCLHSITFGMSSSICLSSLDLSSAERFVEIKIAKNNEDTFITKLNLFSVSIMYNSYPSHSIKVT